jgi:large subunit ribosomal protein L17
LPSLSFLLTGFHYIKPLSVTLDTVQGFKNQNVMRHGDKINNLGRTTAHRKALLSNLACQLIQYKRITTTLAKAKSLRMYVEPMITKSKSDTVNNRRLVFAKLQDKEAIKELFGAVSDKVASRPGGYTRIIKLAPRMGDAAEMAMIELVDFNTIYTKDAKAGTAKKTRRSRGGATTKTTAPKAETTVATEEAPATEAPEQTKEEGAAE